MLIDRRDAHRYKFCFLFYAAGTLLAACTERVPEPSSDLPRAEMEQSCDAPGVREVVERLGERLKLVPLLAPDIIVMEAIREAYSPLVTPSLLNRWIAEPARAPGREVSSPWPERIEVGSVEPAGAGLCRVEGEVVYATSAELTQGGAAFRERVVLQVTGDGRWRISAYEVVAPSSADSTSASAEAAEALRRYYAAIDARDFRGAYELWEGDGAASGQTFEAFAAGFTETARVAINIGRPGRVEPAAGSWYVEVPVVVQAATVRGEEQRFEGTYTLRRAVGDGTSAAQRRWRIYSAALTRVR